MTTALKTLLFLTQAAPLAAAAIALHWGIETTRELERRDASRHIEIVVSDPQLLQMDRVD